MRPPVPLARPRRCSSWRTSVTVGLLPARLRRAYGFALGPACARSPLRGGAEYAKRLVVPLLPARMRLVPSARRAA